MASGHRRLTASSKRGRQLIIFNFYRRGKKYPETSDRQNYKLYGYYTSCGRQTIGRLPSSAYILE